MLCNEYFRKKTYTLFFIYRYNTIILVSAGDLACIARDYQDVIISYYANYTKRRQVNEKKYAS